MVRARLCSCGRGSVTTAPVCMICRNEADQKALAARRLLQHAHSVLRAHEWLQHREERAAEQLRRRQEREEYARRLRYTRAPRLPKPPHLRVLARVVKPDGEDGCWICTLAATRKGYVVVRTPDGPRPAHRVVYEALVGPIPAGLTLDHVKARGCTSRACVNPAHLEPVSNLVNILRGDGPTALNARKTHCLRGHPFSRDNTRRTPDGKRKCRACIRLARARTG